MQVLAISFALVAQGACAAVAPRASAGEESEEYYVRATSLFRSTTLASEARFSSVLGAEFEGARLTILRDFQKQTQIQIIRVRDGEFEEIFLEASFATPSFGAPSEEMDDGSTRTSADVSSYLIEIASEEFAATMAALHPLIDVPVESASQSAVGCLHPAGAYFESIEAKNRAFFSRSGCDNDFGTNVLQTAPLFEFAMKKLPSASNDFDFAASLFKELASKAKKSEN